MPNGQPNPSAASTLTGYLNVIGLFIGTHGLAVFLVVYYATILYPELRQERGDWIEQITRLRQLVDPTTRPLNRSQAEAVLGIITNVHLERLRQNTEIFASQRDTSMSWSLDSIRFWGEEYEFDVNKEMTDDQRYRELTDLLERFEIVLADRRQETRADLLHAYDASKEKNDAVAYQLGRLRFEDTTLEDVWRKSVAGIRDIWIAGLDTLGRGETSFELAEFRKFLAKHPSYDELKSKEPEKLGNVLPRPAEVKANPYSDLQTALGKAIDENLNHAESQSSSLRPPTS